MSGGLGHPIEEVWVWVAEHGEGDEGVVAVYTAQTGGWMPLVGAEPQSLEWMRKFAEQRQPHIGVPMRCKRFRLVEVVDELPTRGTIPSGNIPYAN